MPDGFYSDETLIISHETLSFSLLTISAKLMIFNVMKSFMKFPLGLAEILKYMLFFPFSIHLHLLRILRINKQRDFLSQLL